MNKKKLFTIFGALLIMFAFIFSIYLGPAMAGGGSLCYGTNNFAAEAAAGDKSSGDFMEARLPIPLGYFESMPPEARHVFVAA